MQFGLYPTHAVTKGRLQALSSAQKLKPRQKLGKFRIEKLLGEGASARVYRALDTVEGGKVALKVWDASVVAGSHMEDFRKEIKVSSKLEHPNILSIKNADFIENRFVIVYPLADQTLADRMDARLNLPTALRYSEQLLEALAHAHTHKVIHCDIKPENILLFGKDRIRLADFGIAKFAQHTVQASGSGTLGYIAPEQAMGRPSLRSDVFAAGLVIYRLLSGKLPEWPFEDPLPGMDVLRRKLPQDMVRFLKKAIDLKPRKRFTSCDAMLRAFRPLHKKSLLPVRKRREKKKAEQKDWQVIRDRQFLRSFGRTLEARHQCTRCGGPVSETMYHCPWCQKERKRHNEEHRFNRSCPRCRRGLKSDWKFCPWCYGPSVGETTDRELSDRRYDGRCANSACSRKDLMPWMRYCPWCHRKVKKRWSLAGGTACPSCSWGIASEFWDYCAWCGTGLEDKH